MSKSVSRIFATAISGSTVKFEKVKQKTRAAVEVVQEGPKAGEVLVEIKATGILKSTSLGVFSDSASADA